MKLPVSSPFEDYIKTLPAGDRAALAEFFSGFDSHCILAKAEKRKLREDFEKAILYYVNSNLSLGRALELLDPANLGGFYARPAVLWFPLDDAAKIYPLSMKPGSMSVFRLSVYLKEPVVPELLQMALDFAIRRFPSFATTLKKGFFWHYLDTAKRRFTVSLESDIPCRPLKVSQSGSPAFRVLYWDRRISVEFFHVLTDGTGGMVFLKALTGEYLRLKGIDACVDKGPWALGETPSPEEFENAFARIEQSSSSSGFVERAALQMSGRLSENRPCRVFHFRMDAAGLHEAAKKYRATVTVYLLALMFMAGKAATDQLKGEQSIQVPVNMRKFYPSKTVRNFSLYCGIRLPIEKIGDMEAMTGEISRQLESKGSKEAMNRMLTGTERLVNSLRFVPLAVKQPAARLIYGFLGDKIFTNTLSNMGVVQLPDRMAKEIEAMDFVLGTAISNRASCSLVTVNNTAMFSIAKLTADPSFEEKLYELLTRDGVEVKVEGSELYES